MIELIKKCPLTVFGGSANQVEMKMAMRDASGCMFEDGCLVVRTAGLGHNPPRNTARKGKSEYAEALDVTQRPPPGGVASGEFTSVNAAPAFGNDIPLIY